MLRLSWYDVQASGGVGKGSSKAHQNFGLQKGCMQTVTPLLLGCRISVACYCKLRGRRRCAGSRHAIGQRFFGAGACAALVANQRQRRRHSARLVLCVARPLLAPRSESRVKATLTACHTSHVLLCARSDGQPAECRGAKVRGGLGPQRRGSQRRRVPSRRPGERARATPDATCAETTAQRLLVGSTAQVNATWS